MNNAINQRSHAGFPSPTNPITTTTSIRMLCVLRNASLALINVVLLQYLYCDDFQEIHTASAETKCQVLSKKSNSWAGWWVKSHFSCIQGTLDSIWSMVMWVYWCPLGLQFCIAFNHVSEQKEICSALSLNLKNSCGTSQRITHFWESHTKYSVSQYITKQNIATGT